MDHYITKTKSIDHYLPKIRINRERSCITNEFHGTVLIIHILNANPAVSPHNKFGNLQNNEFWGPSTQNNEFWGPSKQKLNAGDHLHKE
jgi:hypothetical protein